MCCRESMFWMEQNNSVLCLFCALCNITPYTISFGLSIPWMWRTLRSSSLVKNTSTQSGGSMELLQEASADTGFCSGFGTNSVTSDWWSNFPELYLLFEILAWNYNCAGKFHDPVTSETSFLTERKKSQPDCLLLLVYYSPSSRVPCKWKM